MMMTIDQTRNAPLQPRPVWNSLKRTIRYHAGSVALGAFLVAVVQLIRSILAYLDRQTKGTRKELLLETYIQVCCMYTILF